ncbi:MAG: carboxypeptidase regulatory-like domain-containing protein [Acidobacteriota bacterium]
MKTRNAMGFVFLCFLLAALPGWPQASTGAVSGTVRDQTGAVIPGAVVSLANTATNVASKTSTNVAGFYLFPGVVPGPYKLAVEASGMQKFEGALTVQVQQSAVVDVVLKVGTTTTAVEVLDVTPLLTVDRPTLGHVLERQRIEQLPINGRYVTSLLQTVPGMEGTRAYGLREGSHEMVLDGAALSDRLWGGVIRRPPGLDTIEEFKVENNNSSAKFNRPTTIVLSTKSGTNQLHGSAFWTWRNNAFGKARTRTDYYAKAPFLNRNEFGPSAGGPVIIPKLYNGKDRTFWFFAYEGHRNVAPYTQGYPVPTEAMRNGDFRELVDSQGRQYKIYDPSTTNLQTWSREQVSYRGQLNVIDPARISPLAKYLFSITPLPTMPDVNPMLERNWWAPVPNSTRQWTTTTRLDHRLTDSDRIYGRYTHGDTWQFAQKFTQPMLNKVPGTVRRLEPNKNLALSWVRTFSPTFFNEVLVSGSRSTWWMGTGEPGIKYADQLGLPNPLDVAGWPGLYDTGLGDYYFETDNTQASSMLYAIVENHATKIAGKHELQFGFYHRYDQLNLLPDQQQNQGNHSWSTGATALYDPSSSRTNPLATPFTNHNLANMYLGIMNYSNQFVRGYFYMRAKEYALYFQDNYKVSPRLTLNLGLRWEYWPPYREKNNIITSFDPQKRAVVLGQDLDSMYRLGATVPAIVNRLTSLGAKFITYKEAGVPQSLMDSTWKDFGPRLGFAYRAGDGARSFVMRGGYRISYFHIPARPWVARMRSNAPLTARFRTSLTDASLTPDGIGNYGMRSAPTVIAGKNSRDAVTLNTVSGLNRGSAGASYFARNQPDAQVQDWNLTLEKEVMPDTVVRLGYVGNHGGHLEQFFQYNNPTPDYIWFVTTGERLPTGEYSAVARRSYDKVVYGGIEEYRMTGWSNFNGLQFEMERRYRKGYGFQIFYVVGNTLGAGGQEWSGTSVLPELNQFLPGAVPAGIDERNRFLNYQRDTGIPKHRVRWNWIVDLPFGKGKWLGGNAGGVLDRFIGGWQVAGLGSLRSTYFSLPTGIYPTGNPIELYGYQYPIEDCRSGRCYPGYLWWNGYIPANQINSTDAQGRPNGVMGVPANYKPAGQPLIPWPAKPDRNDPMYSYFGSNTVWITLKDGTVQRTTFSDGLHPWRQQYFPSTRQWGLDASLFKRIPITERVNFRINLDAFNVLNHPGNPSGAGGDGILSTRSSGSGARELQLTLRLSW